MNWYHFYCFLPVFLLAGISSYAQQQLNTNGRTPDSTTTASVNFNREKDKIPGNTMGEKLESLLFWNEAEKERRFPMMQNIFPCGIVAAGNNPMPLRKGKPLQPKWVDGTTLRSYLQDNHIGGIIVLQNDKIRLEVYNKNVTQNTVWTSFSMAKSVSSMLLGIALKDGSIRSIDDPLSRYIPELKGRDYGKVTIKQLLTMTSGIDWNEDYEDPHSDVAQMYLHPCVGQEAHILTYMKPLKSIHSPGTFWNYSTGETDLLGILIQKATGKRLSDYLSEKIWKPCGMAHQAYWLSDECSQMNIGGSGISATLRDYARLGVVMLHNGNVNGQSLFASGWLVNATRPLYATDESGSGYGYLWWVFPDDSFTAVGIFGQMIYVNPKKNLVIAQIAAWPKATSKELVQSRHAFIKAVEEGL